MKIDFSKQLVNFNGEVIKNGDTGEEMTLGSACVDALLVIDRNNPIEVEEKLERYKLAKAIHEGKKGSLSEDESSLIRKLVSMYYPTIIVGQIFDIFDSAE